jgi:hypothetical protein
MHFMLSKSEYGKIICINVIVMCLRKEEPYDFHTSGLIISFTFESIMKVWEAVISGLYMLVQVITGNIGKGGTGRNFCTLTNCNRLAGQCIILLINEEKHK